VLLFINNYVLAEILNVPDDFETIQGAIDASENGDTVLVEPGEYVENIDFSGKNIVVMGNPDDPSETIIDGDQFDTVVIFSAEEDSTAALIGFTLRNGRHDLAGGIWTNEASPTLSHLIITNNHGRGIRCDGNSRPCFVDVTVTDNTGDGIYCHSSNPTLTNVVSSSNAGYGLYFHSSNSTLTNVESNGNSGAGLYFDNCESILTIITSIENDGDGIETQDSRVRLDDFILNNNGPEMGGDNGPAMGGGFNIGSSLEETIMNNGIIRGNRGSQAGGGVCQRAELNMTNVTISDNSCASYWGSGGFQFRNEAIVTLTNVSISNNTGRGRGGGIYTERGSLTLTDVIINGNAAGEGGGIYINGTPTSLTDVIVNGNTVNTNGGGIYTDRTRLTMRRVSLTNNSAEEYGGGIWVSACQLVMDNVTISGDSAVRGGGGIYLINGSTADLVNTICWNNSRYEVMFRRDGTPNEITVSYSDITGGVDGIFDYNNGDVNWGDGNINEDPLFVNPDTSNYHLTEDSPCIDAGDPDSDRDPDLTRADMGAYYFDQGGFESDFDLDPENLDFGEVSVNGSHTLSFAVINTSDNDIVISDISVDNDDFSVDFENDIEVEVDADYDVEVTFTPDEVGEYEGEVTVTVNYGGRIANVPLSGTSFVAPTGDANGDNEINVQDIVTIVGYIIGNDPAPFLFDAADVNEDDVINVLDIIGVVNIILNGGDGRDAAPERLTNAIINQDDQHAVLKIEGNLGGLQHTVKSEELSNVKIYPLEGMELVTNKVSDEELLVLIYSFKGRTVSTGQYVLISYPPGTEVEVSGAIIGDPSGVGGKIPVIAGDVVLIPDEYQLYQNFPNPFNQKTTLAYDLPEVSDVVLKIYNLLGREVYHWNLNDQQAGRYRVIWSGVNNQGIPVTSGLYLVRFETERYNSTRKMILLM